MWKITKAAFWQWQSDNAPRLAAALTFYMIFSLAPTFVIVLAIGASVVGESAARGELTDYLERYLGPSRTRIVVQIGEDARGDASGPLTTIVGIGTLVFGSTIAFSELQSGLNLVWGVAERGGFSGIVYRRLVAFLMVVALGLLLLVSLATAAVFNTASGWLDVVVPHTDILTRAGSAVFSFIILAFTFSMIYRYVPETEIKWRDVWIGGVMTALLFDAGNFLIGVWLGRLAVQSLYGAAASLVAVLLWIYYSALVFFFGAEWTQAYASERGSKIGAGRSPASPG